MTAAAPESPPPVVVREPWLQSVHPVYRMVFRWLFIVATTFLAFHSSLRSVVEVTRAGSLGGYVWVVPIAGGLAAIGVARRNRTELPIHDRQTDVIVGIMGLVLAGLLHAVLLQRYALYFYLLRLDLVAMWTFAVSASIALFGLRPVLRFGWVWLLLSMVFALPYYLVVITLGGTKVAAALGTMIIAGIAAGISVHRDTRRGMIGSSLGWAVGILIIVVMAVWFPDAPLLAYQLVPGVTAICISGSAMYLYARRGAELTWLDRRMEPLAAKQVWAAMPVVLVVALGLSFVRLPAVGFAPTRYVPAMRIQEPADPLLPAAGWQIHDTQVYSWVKAMYGRDATLVRQKVVADTGDIKYDKFARPRTLMVDTVTTFRPFSLKVFPARMIYHVENIRLSGIRRVDLGYGVSADVFSAIDDKLLVTWDGIQWTWTNGQAAQRVFVIAVDNHEDDAPFPAPTGAVGPTLNSMFTVLFRGNSSTLDTNPNRKDDALLTEFAHDLVRAQLEPLGIAP